MSNCAITRTGGAETCFTKQELQSFAQKYNDNHSDKINLKQNKTKLYHDLRKRFSCTIEADACILESLDLDRDRILKPKQPDGSYAWLSTIDISDVMAQYERKYKSFLFLGVVPIDFHNIYPGIGNLRLNKTKQNKIGLILNLDPSYMSGSHWVSFFIDKKNKTICFFDSAGDEPPEQVQKLIEHLKRQGNYKVVINKNVHQRGNTACGIYSMYFIIERLKGRSCQNIFSDVIHDRDMNKKRKEYFSEI